MSQRSIAVRDLTWVAAAILALLVLVASIPPGERKSPADDIEAINTVIDRFQEAYSNERQNDLRQLFFAESVIAYDQEEGMIQGVAGLEDWLHATQEQVFDVNTGVSDTLSDREIQVYGNIAYVVCSYVYRDDLKRHEGTDIFTLMKMRDRWRILSLQWTGGAVPTH